MVWQRVALAVAPMSQRDELADELGYVRHVPLETAPQSGVDNELYADVSASKQLQLAAAHQVSSPVLPPWVMAYISTDQHQDKTSKPVDLLKATTETVALSSADGSYRFPPSPLLAQRKQWLPLIYKQLALPEMRSGVDVAVLCDALARYKTLAVLPKTQRLYWPDSIEIWIDNSMAQLPYWRDYYSVAETLRNLLGSERVRIYRSTQLTDAEQPKASACLLLSHRHLKALPYEIYQRYLSYATRMQLTPGLSAGEQQACAFGWPQASIPEPVSAVTDVSGIELALTSLSAIAVTDKHLLRTLRLALGWGGAVLEAELWNHEDVQDIGLGIALKPSAKAKYEEKYMALYANNRAYVDALETLVTGHLSGTYAGLKHLQTLSFDVLSGRPSSSSVAWDYVKRLCAETQMGGAGGSSIQCKTYVSCLPQCVFENSTYDEVSYNLVHHSYPNQLPDEMPLGFDPAKLPAGRVQADKQARVKWYLSQPCSGEIELSKQPPSITPLAVIDAYTDEPVRVQMGAQQILISAPQRLCLSQDKPQTLKTTLQQITIKPLVRPAWACEFGRDKKGDIYAYMPYQGKALVVPYNTEAEQWQFPTPFGEDQYGLYLDIDLKGVTQRFRWIPPGHFLMGSPEDEPERRSNEQLHPVQISKGFWLADTTVSQTLWKAFQEENPSKFKDDDFPVDSVSWLDAMAFIEVLNSQSEFATFSLPTEAQWEYACRAGTTTPFNMGHQLTTDQANYNGNYPYTDGSIGEFRKQTTRGNSFPPNVWGLYQMHGNLWEWCMDEYKEYLAEPDQAMVSVDPLNGSVSAENGIPRLLRGGSWCDYGRVCRSACRNHNPADGRVDVIGLRLALGHELKAGGASAQALRSDA